jgi:hypothetical protein
VVTDRAGLGVPESLAHRRRLAAATIRNRTGVSVADAHLGSVADSASDDHVTVITSDPGDARTVVGDTGITVVTL